jgi:hypothetical protein
MHTTTHLRRSVGAAVLLGVVCGGLATSAGASTPLVSKSTVQSQAAKILARETGQKAPKVSCPSGSKAKVGATIHCTVIPHGSTLKYPATITVTSIHGSTANFHVQVGQAPGQANKTKFCADNATINNAVSGAASPQAFVQALEANQQAILDFQNTAPSSIVQQAGVLVQAARQAITSGDATIFTTKTVSNAVTAIDTFCGQRATSGSTSG